LNSFKSITPKHQKTALLYGIVHSSLYENLKMEKHRQDCFFSLDIHFSMFFAARSFSSPFYAETEYT